MTTKHSAAAVGRHSASAMLLALCLGVALSQAYRTVAGILAAPLQTDLGLTAPQLGGFAATFHFAFAASQLFVGASIDLYGIRRTILTAFPLTVVGAAVSAWGAGYEALLIGQALIGIGCSPAFLVCTVLIARAFPHDRFATLSGMTMSIGGVGLLATGTPMAWLVDAAGWRAAFVALSALSLAAWLVIWRVVGDDRPAAERPRESIGASLMGFARLFLLPHTAGIVVLSFVVYASFLTLRGLWLSPLLMERGGLSLVQSGHVVLAASVLSVLTPPLAGRLDPGPGARRRVLVACTITLAGLFALLAIWRAPTAAIVLSLAIAVLQGVTVLQYSDTRASYPAHLTGRGLGVFTLAMFLGIAVMQWLTGWVAAGAEAIGMDVYLAVFGTVSVLLLAGAAAFRWLPQPPVVAR